MPITPETIAKSGTEHGEQTALFCWAANYANMVDNRLKLMFAIPNGDQRGDGTKKGAVIAGARLKAEGQRDGVPDLMLPVAMNTGFIKCYYHGLFIEMKRREFETRKDGGCSEEQLRFHLRLRDQGYYVEVCYGWEQARDTILNYLNQKLPGNYGKDRRTEK